MESKDAIALIIGGIILVVIVGYLVCNQVGKIKEWLIWAVTEAERALGGGTGQLKLRQVYDWFVAKFSCVAALVPFSVFSSWVDEALVTLEKWLTDNKQVSNYVANKEDNNAKYK